MTEISIKTSSSGLTYTLADYAKTFNDGKEIKLTRKQWSNVLDKIILINNNRNAEDKIFTGGTNINGPSRKNFVQTGSQITFSEEELEIILQEMGIKNIKGLCIENKTAKAETKSPAPTAPTPATVELAKTVPMSTPSQENTPSSPTEELAYSHSTPQTNTFSAILNNLEQQNPPIILKTPEEVNSKENLLNVKTLKKQNAVFSKLGGPHASIEVYNKKGELIAYKTPNGTFIKKDKQISEEDFNNYVERKGKTLNITKQKFTTEILPPKIELANLPNIKSIDIHSIKIDSPELTIFKPITPFEINGEIIKVSNQEIKNIVASASQKYGVDEKLILAIIHNESGFVNGKTSTKGAMGLMQLMPKTAAGIGVKDPWDPKQNIEGGTKILKSLLKYYDGDVQLALAGYNYGMGNVNKKLAKYETRNIADIYSSLPNETQKYIKEVYSNYIATKAQS